jgi:hypothetical protein
MNLQFLFINSIYFFLTQASPALTPRLNALSAGRFFESFEMQLLTLSLITFDVAAAVATTLLTCGGYPDTPLAQVALNALEVRALLHLLTCGAKFDESKECLWRDCFFFNCLCLKTIIALNFSGSRLLLLTG